MRTLVTTAALSPAVAQAVAFTGAYRQHRHDPAPLREAACLRTQFPAILGPLREDDALAGRRPAEMIVYIGTIWWAAYPGRSRGNRAEGKQGGYCFDFAAPERPDRTDEERRVLAELASFWETECTLAKVHGRWEPSLRQHTGGHAQIDGTSIGFCVAPDLDHILRLGLTGLRDAVAARRQAGGTGAEAAFLTGLATVVELLFETCRHYETQARQLAETAAEPRPRARFRKMADVLLALRQGPPATFAEAVQLAWLCTLLTGGKHIEGWRLDVALGDFYCRDIDSGIETEESALDLLQALWQAFFENGEAAVCRIVIGGRGRRNPGYADRFSLAAMEATRRHRKVTPQLTLRFHADQAPALLAKAYDVLAEGCTYPMLYNDDVVVPGVSRSLHVPPEVAERYHPLGCGEYMLGACSPSLLDCGWSIPKSLEAALHNGRSDDGRAIGPPTGAAEELDSFGKLQEAVRQQVAFAASLSARIYRHITDVYAGECAFLLASLFTDDCLARGRALFDGGVRYRGACVMGHGFTNAADGLTAIRRLVYDERRVPLNRLVAALDRDFEGEDDLRRLMLACPKFGNDDPSADRELVDLWRDISAAADAAGREAGFDFHTVSSVNPGGYGMGRACGATADGRRRGEPFAIGNAPTAGFDRNGLTALLSSVARVDAANGGAATNIKLSRAFFTGGRDKLTALFGAYFASGGQQVMITVIDRHDLEAALAEPARYSHVLVRVGGWSARFIDLEPAVQQEILRRTLY